MGQNSKWRLPVIVLMLILSFHGNLKAQPIARPLVIFVNGQWNCCAHSMNQLAYRLRNELGAELRYMSYSRFDGADSSTFDSDSQFVRGGANFINNILEFDRPLILVGHSYGGDSILELLPWLKRRVQVVAVVDPVSTMGWRWKLAKHKIWPTVDYFYNRWQTHVPFPNDFKVDGHITCNAAIECKQEEQNISRRLDGSPIMSQGYQKRVSHQSLATDDFLQKDLGDFIVSRLRGKAKKTYAANGYYRPDGQPRVYYLNRSEQTVCHVQNPQQMDAYGGYRLVKVVQGTSFASGMRLINECSWPDGMYKTRSNPAVYLLHSNGRSACWIQSPIDVQRRGGWNRVNVVDDSSKLLAGRLYVPQC